jgi:hypothetical protein
MFMSDTTHHKVARRARRQPGLIVGIVALVAALAGTATALPGRNNVDTNDVKRDAIKAKQIKDGQVGAAEIVDGSIGTAEIAPGEIFHEVGAPGEPQFFNGGEGDCLWKPGIPTIDGTAPVSFAKDTLGNVVLRGAATPTDGTGGDAKCDPAQAGESEDGIAFTLPPGYRPGYVDLSGLAAGPIVAPDAGAIAGPYTLSGGAVFAAMPGPLVLDSVEFRPAEGANTASAPARISLRTLRQLGDR